MKKYIVSIIIVIVTLALTYLAFGFIINDLNSGNWDIGTRGFMVFIGIVASGWMLLLYHDVLS